MSEPSLVEKTVVVLGSSSPHGTAAIRLMAREGANLALGGRSREQLEMLQKEIESSGGQAVIVGTHLAKRHHPAHLVEAAVCCSWRIAPPRRWRATRSKPGSALWT